MMSVMCVCCVRCVVFVSEFSIIFTRDFVLFFYQKFYDNLYAYTIAHIHILLVTYTCTWAVQEVRGIWS